MMFAKLCLNIKKWLNLGQLLGIFFYRTYFSILLKTPKLKIYALFINIDREIFLLYKFKIVIVVYLDRGTGTEQAVQRSKIFFYPSWLLFKLLCLQLSSFLGEYLCLAEAQWVKPGVSRVKPLKGVKPLLGVNPL